MQDNEYVKLIAALDLKNSAKKINQDIKQLEKTVNYLRLTASLYKGESKKQINAVISEMQNSLKGIKLKASINKQETQKALDNVLKDISIGDIKINENGLRLKARKALLNVQSEVSKLPIPINFEIRKQNLQNHLTSYLSKNSRIRESSTLLKEADNLRALFDTIGDKNSLRIATEKFGLFKSEVTATGFATKSTTDKVNDLVGKFARITSIFGVLNMGIQKYRQSLTTLKDISTTLTEIAKTSNMVSSELEQLGDDSFGIASKYGKTASNYLEGVREMARSGYNDMSKELGELSVLAQSAGDMTSEMANNYLLATDAAYKYSGSIDKLTTALDGANYISNNNSASLTDIADATRVSASYAAQAGVEIDQLTAAESAMIAVTKRSGSEMGRAFRSILLNLQQVSGEFDGEIIDEESLKKVEDRCHSLGIELETMTKDGAKLRNPIEVLKELSEVYNSLPKDSAERAGIISDIGGKYHANALAALLGRWDLYEKMLGEFSQGAGSSLREAQKTAESWEGRLNALQNQWDSFVNHITDQNMIKGGISLVDNILKSAESLVDTLGAIPTLLTAINGTYTALNKDYGITQIFNPETNKLDMQGNMFGIDFTAIKAQKQHFIEAEKAILQWNSRLKRGQTDLEKFGAEVVKNNAQLRTYLSTTSKEAPASLAGYKASLNAAGVSTDSLRLKTVLMTSAMTFGLSFALQAAMTGFSKLMQYQEDLRESTVDAANTYNDSSKSIEDYTSRYKELHDALLAAKGNEEETYNVKKQLLDLQTELNDKFGEEYGKLNLVTDAYNDQTDAIKAYNKEAAQKYLIDNRKGIEQATDQMEKSRTYHLGSTGNLDLEENQKIYEIALKYQDDGISLKQFDTDDVYGYTIEFDGNAEKAEEVIHELANELRELQNTDKELKDNSFINNILDISSDALKKNQVILDDYKNQYYSALTAEVTSNDSLAPQFEKALKTVEAYNEAVLRSENPADDKKVDKAYADLQKVKAGIQENEEEWGKYSAITDDVFAQADTGLYEFRDAIKENKDGIADLINQFKGKTDTDLLSLSNVGDDKTFNKLIAYADEYGLSVNQVVDELIRMETITGEIVKETSNEINPFSKGEMIAAINEMSSGFESLNKIMDSISGKKAFDFSLLDNKDFKETFSGLGDTYTDFVEKISSSPKDINVCQSAFDDLLTAWLNSTDVIKRLSDDTADLTTNMLSNMGVANAEEVVTSVLAQKHALLAAEKEYSVLTSQKLSDATTQDIADFYNSADATDTAKQSVIQYYIEKQFAAGITLDTSGDVEQLINLVSALGGATDALGIYYKALSGDLNYTDISGMGGGDAKYFKQMAQVQANAELEKIKARMSANVVAPKLSGGAKSGGSKGGKGSSKEDTKKDFDWIERKLKLLEDKRAELEDKASSSALSYLGISESDLAKAQELLEKFGSQATLTGNDITSLGDLASKTGMFIGDFIDVLKNNGLDSRQGYLSQQLEIEKEILAERQKATQQYLAKYEETVSKLPDDLRQKVANGGDDIETLTGDEATYAQEAIDARDKYLESLENEDQAKQNLIETTKKSYELELDYLDQQASRLNHQNTMIEKQIDLLNASGQMVNVSSYEQILANMHRQEEILNKKIAQKRKEMQALLESGYIEEDSEEYFQMQQYIESCEESLADLAIEQEEYNDKIRQLPIENMQKVINMYEDISNALRDYADIMEASGKKLDAEYFQMQIVNGRETVAQYKEQAELIRDIMDEYEVGSDKYTEMYNKLQDINSAISNIAQNMHEWNKELLALPLNSMNNRLDGLGNVLSALQDVQSDHEVVINAVTSAIQKQIEALEEQRDLGVESAQAEIDALQEKLDLLQKQNKERQIQLALEQARYDLERAQNQKTNKVVRNGIVDYEADQDAIRNASQSKADAEYNKVVHDLEKQKEALEDNLEAIEESYQKQIDLLNEMAEKWSKIKTDAEDTANAAIADQYLGSGWADKVTSGNDNSIYEAFKKSYETNNQMVQKYEKQIESTEKIYNLLNSYIAAYQAGTLSYEEAMSSIKSLLSQMNKDMSAGQAVQNVIDYLAKVNDTEANADAVLSGIQAQLKADSDEMIKNLEQYNENLDLIAGCMTSWEQLTSNIGDIRNLMDEVIDSLESGFDDIVDALGDYSRRRDEEEDDDDYGDHSSGTVSPGGTSNNHYTGNDVNTSGSQDNDHGPGVEKYAKGIENGPVGSKLKITDEEFERLKRGADETIRRFKNGEVPIIAHEGEVVFNPDQQRALLDNLNYYRQRSFMIPSSQGMSLISGGSRETNIDINVGGITLTDVRDVDGLTKGIMHNLEPSMRQRFLDRNSIWD